MSTKHERQIDLLNYLFNGKREIYANLSSHFFVSVKTIKNDISELSIYYPIVTYIGRNGGVEMSKGYVINGFIMKKEYIELLTQGLLLLKKQTPSFDFNIIETIDKLLSMLNLKR